MARKNIFQLVEENYNIQDEIEKINDLFYETDYFSDAKCGYTLYELIDEYLLEKWRYRQTCLDVDEYLERANAELPNRSHEPISEDIIINFLEVIENFLKLYFDNATPLLEKYRIKPYNSLHTTFRMIVSKLEKHMGLTIREYQDKIIL